MYRGSAGHLDTAGHPANSAILARMGSLLPDSAELLVPMAVARQNSSSLSELLSQPPSEIDRKQAEPPTGLALTDDDDGLPPTPPRLYSLFPLSLSSLSLLSLSPLSPLSLLDDWRLLTHHVVDWDDDVETA